MQGVIMKKILGLLLIISIIAPLNKDDDKSIKPVFTYGNNIYY